MAAIGIANLNLDLNAIRVMYTRFQTAFLLIASLVVFCFSKFFNEYKEKEAMRLLDLFLICLGLTAVPGFVVHARVQLVDRMGRWGFAVLKSIVAVLLFFFFRWLGLKMIPHKDYLLAIASVFFFLYILSLRCLLQVTDDFGASQGFLVAAYTITIGHFAGKTALWLTALFTFLTVIMNVTAEPAQQVQQEAAQLQQGDDEDLGVGEVEDPGVH